MSLDEAWGESAAAFQPRPPSPSLGAARAPSPPPHAAARRALAADDGGRDEVRACADSLLAVAAELRALRDATRAQQREQRTVLYVAIGVVVLLLLLTAHSYLRLQHATDCLLHWRR